MTTKNSVTRRRFLQTGAAMAAMLGLGRVAVRPLAAAVAAIHKGTAPLLWLQGLSCTGCSVSLLNSENPGPAQILTQYLSVGFHSTISAATGHLAVAAVNKMIQELKGQYILAMEGALPAGMPSACEAGGEEMTALFKRAATSARAVLAVGTCAVSGGIPAAEGNPTAAVSAGDYLKEHKIDVPLIALPGCPAHPDWIVGTVAHVLKFGIPKLDERNRPVAFYGKLVHDQCPRFADYEREKFATRFGEAGCLFRLGCMGVTTRADCTLRQWNGGTNTCTRCGSPCIGCASEHFAARANLPFYRKNELQRKPQKKEDGR